jgi:hypothetical protein
LIATDVEQELKERGDEIDAKLEAMIHKISVHTDTIESQLGKHMNETKENYKVELQKTLTTVKEENQKVFEMLEALKARLPAPEA